MRTIPSVNLPGSFPVAAARSGARIVRGSVTYTPLGRETGRPRAAQFAPCAVYIPGGGTTGCGRKERRMAAAFSRMNRRASHLIAGWRTGLSRPVLILQAGNTLNYFGYGRSEERRVGKEC